MLHGVMPEAVMLKIGVIADDFYRRDRHRQFSGRKRDADGCEVNNDVPAGTQPEGCDAVVIGT